MRSPQKFLRGMDCEYEFLFVNDGSKDATLSILKDLAERDEHVTYLSFSRNFGKEAAMYAGFTNAKGDYVAVMDADMQDPPALLPQMLALLYIRRVRQCGDTQGQPRGRAADPQLVCKKVLPDYQPDFRCGYRGRCPRFQTDEAGDGGCDRGDGENTTAFPRESLDGSVFRTYWLPYENVNRVAGETKWNFWASVKICD